MKPFSLSKLIASRPICIMQCSGQYNAKSCQLLCEKARVVQERGDRVRQTLIAILHNSDFNLKLRNEALTGWFCRNSLLVGGLDIPAVSSLLGMSLLLL